jgi:hypothetical protein
MCKCLAFVVDVGDSATVNVTSVPSPELAKDKEREVMNSKPAMTDALTGASSAPHSNGKTSERKKKNVLVVQCTFCLFCKQRYNATVFYCGTCVTYVVMLRRECWQEFITHFERLNV